MSTYYVATTGNDSNPGTLASPFLTINQGISVMVGGDTLFVRAGTYNQNISWTPPSGSSFSAPTTISRYQNEAVTFQATNNNAIWGAISYVVLNGIRFFGSGYAIGNGAHHIRMTSCEITNNNATSMQGLQIEGGSSFNEIIGCNIHNNGTNTGGGDHGLYIKSDNNLFYGNIVSGNASCGFHLYDSGSTDVHDNIIRGNIVFGNTGPSCAGILISNGSNNWVYNNIVYGNTGNGIMAYQGGDSTRVYNNTVYNNGDVGLLIFAGDVSSTIWKNNISFNNAGGDYTDNGTGTVQSNNLTTDPDFVDAGSNDFHLLVTSDAIDAGVDLTAEGIIDDFAGHFRPTGPGFDIGAYEAFFSALDPATIFLNKSDSPVVTESVTRNLNPQGTIHISIAESPVATDRIANQGVPDTDTLNPGGMTEGAVFFSAENPKTYDLRVVEERYGANGIIEWDLVREDISVYDWVSESPLLGSLIGGGSPVPTPPEDDHSDQSQPGATRIVFLDIPTLLSQHDGPGFYVAAGGISDGFAGSILYEKKGDAYIQIAELGGRAVIGIANTRLDSGPVTTFDVGGRTFVFDDTNTVDITLIDNVSTLSSVSDADMLAGSNAVALGADGRWEILSFGVRTQLSEKKYRLSHLLRGLKGTEWAIDLHAVSDTFVLLNSTIRRIHDEFTDLDVARTFRAVSIGEAFGSASNRTFTDTGVSLKPLSPVFLRASEDDDQNRTLMASRRSRLDGLAGLDTYDPPPPLGETILKFEIDILDAPETTVLRTITTVHEFALYTAAQQTADFGSVPSELHLCWYQISETRGRGYAGCSVITVFDEDPPDPPSSGVDSIAILGDAVQLTGDVTVSITGGTSSITRTGQNLLWTVDVTGGSSGTVETPTGDPEEGLVDTTKAFIFDDFLMGLGGYFNVTFGDDFTASGDKCNPSFPGNITLSSSATKSSRAPASGQVFVMKAGIDYECTFLAKAGSSGNQSVDFRIGLRDEYSAGQDDPPGNGCYFERLNGETNWRAVCRANNSTQTRVDTGVAWVDDGPNWPVTINAYTKFRILGTGVSSVNFYLDNVLVATITTNVPTVGLGGIPLSVTPFFMFHSYTSNGRWWVVDYWKLNLDGYTRL